MRASDDPPPAVRRTRAETRERILETARELFYWQGIHAVGVDTVAREAQVAPVTLYRSFGSKDGLIAAYVEREGHGHCAWFERALGPSGRPARDRIIDLFAALTDLVQPAQCRGCPFQMALAELPDPSHPAHEAAVAVKQWVRDQFQTLAAEHVGSRPGDTATEIFADQLTLLFEGAFVTAQALGADGPPSRLTSIVAQILQP